MSQKNYRRHDRSVKNKRSIFPILISEIGFSQPKIRPKIMFRISVREGREGA